MEHFGSNLPTKYAITAATKTETIVDGPATYRTIYPMPTNTANASDELKPMFAKSNKFIWYFGFVCEFPVTPAISTEVGVVISLGIFRARNHRK